MIDERAVMKRAVSKKTLSNKTLLASSSLKRTWLLVSLVSFFCVTTTSFAGDIEAGKSKSVTCSSCHGGNGISSMDMWPNLAGQKAAYLVKQMRAFRDGTRSDPVMEGMAKPLSDADIDDISAYFASLSGK